MGIFTRVFGTQMEKDLATRAERIIERNIDATFNRFVDLDKARDQLHILRNEKATLSEDIAREKLDLKHKLGLERMRQQQDAEIAKERLDALREAIGAEKDLAVKAARFEAKEEALTETRAQLVEFQDRQEKMIEHLLEALPTAELFKQVRD